jgi:hypothetical protein
MNHLGPVGPIHLLGPVGPIHLLGPVGPIHLLGPVGPILGDSFGPCWAHSFVGPCWAHSFSVISHEKWHFGSFLFRRSLFDSILELCRTRRKRLYVPQEINQRRLQMKKYFFRETWGRDQKLEVKGRFLVVKTQFLRKVWKLENQCTSILPQADRPELP